jgi:hypothetical protein
MRREGSGEGNRPPPAISALLPDRSRGRRSEHHRYTMEGRSRLTAPGAFFRRRNSSSVQGLCRRPPRTVGKGAATLSTGNDFPMALSIDHTTSISLGISFRTLIVGGRLHRRGSAVCTCVAPPRCRGRIAEEGEALVAVG